tara:strand:+ start:333 stop:485 length:153 start_codon:yes stop_codon:yes gene_type:complete
MKKYKVTLFLELKGGYLQWLPETVAKLLQDRDNGESLYNYDIEEVNDEEE